MREVHLATEGDLRKAIRHFWKMRESQGSLGGAAAKDGRSKVTGGAQMDGFARIVAELLCDNGIPRSCIHLTRGSTQLPGWFRPEKQWDLVVIQGDELLAALELKSHVGSFGNNFNNRVEEALGNATDILAAYREGAFRPSRRPWLGYLMLVEQATQSTRPVRLRQPHYPAFGEFAGTSYIDRYSLLLRKLMRERMYDACCLLTSSEVQGRRGGFSEPDVELAFDRFAGSLVGHALGLTARSVTPNSADR